MSTTVSKAALEKMTVPQLKDELVKKGLSGEGKKAVLIDRLYDNLMEEELLNTSNGIDNDTASLSEDILNEEAALLDDEPPVKKQPVTSPTTAAAKDDAPKSDSAASETVSATTIALAGVDLDLASTEAKLKRAQRFGLPITGDLAKAKRAERFGGAATTPTAAKSVLTDDAKAKRAERFGLATATPTSGTTPKVLDSTSKEKLISRAARFGLPVNAEGKTTGNGVNPEVLKARAKRFGSDAGDEADEKKKARLERFGLPTK